MQVLQGVLLIYDHPHLGCRLNSHACSMRSHCFTDKQQPCLQVAWHPACDRPGFQSLYDIPTSCDRFSDRAAAACGISMVDLAGASASLQAGGFTGFAPGRSVCLPDGCDPCADDSWLDVIMADQGRQQALAVAWDLDVPVMDAGSADSIGQPASVDAEECEEDAADAVKKRIASLLNIFHLW